MANRYWVGADGTWDSSTTTNWAASSGGASGASAPTSSDNVFFDTLSDVDAYSVTIAAGAVCADCTVAAPLTGNVTWTGSGAMTIHGSLTLYSGLVYSYTGTVTFAATATGKTITTAGTSISSAWTFNGAGGGWTLQDNVTLVTTSVTLTQGALNLNAKTVGTVNTFTSNGASTRSIDMSGSVFSMVGGWTVTSSLTLTVNTSSTISGAIAFTGGGLTYNDVSYSDALSDANTFRNLTLLGNQSKTVNANQVVTGTFTVTGTSASNRLFLNSDTPGTARTITAAAVALTDVDFRDITGAGAGSPFTGTRLGNCAGNSGVTFTTAANKYWVRDANANWNTNTSWATTSGGAAATNNYPLPQDTAIFDAASFSANGRVITIPTNRRIGPIDTSAADQTFTLTNTTSATTMYGGVTLGANTTIGGTTGVWSWEGRNTQVITSAGIPWTQPHTINSIGGTVQLADAFSIVGAAARVFTLTNGTFDINGQTATLNTFSSSNSNARTLKSTAAGGKIICNDTTATTTFTTSAATNLTVTRNSWTIEIGGNTTNVRTMNLGAAITWPTITFTNTTAAGGLDLVCSSTTTVIKSLAYSGGTAQTIRRTAATTITVEDNNGFPSGTLGNVITLGSITAASHTWTKSGGGTITADYMSISRSTATPGATWFATNSTDGGNNSGWDFGGAATVFIPIIGSGPGMALAGYGGLAG